MEPPNNKSPSHRPPSPSPSETRAEPSTSQAVSFVTEMPGYIIDAAAEEELRKAREAESAARVQVLFFEGRNTEWRMGADGGRGEFGPGDMERKSEGEGAVKKGKHAQGGGKGESEIGAGKKGEDGGK